MYKNYPDSFKEDRHIEDAVDEMLRVPKYPYTIDEKRLAEFRHAWDLLIESVDVKPNEIVGKCEVPKIDLSYISIKCPDIKVTNIDKFLEALDLASALDIYAFVDGNIGFDLTFWGIANYIIKDKDDDDEE